MCSKIRDAANWRDRAAYMLEEAIPRVGKREVSQAECDAIVVRATEELQYILNSDGDSIVRERLVKIMESKCEFARKQAQENLVQLEARRQEVAEFEYDLYRANRALAEAKAEKYLGSTSAKSTN